MFITFLVLPVSLKQRLKRNPEDVYLGPYSCHKTLISLVGKVKIHVLVFYMPFRYHLGLGALANFLMRDSRGHAALWDLLDSLFSPHNLQINKSTIITNLQHFCHFIKFSRTKILSLINLLNTEITWNLELLDWIFAKCVQMAAFSQKAWIAAFLWKSRDTQSAKAP